MQHEALLINEKVCLLLWKVVSWKPFYNLTRVLLLKRGVLIHYFGTMCDRLDYFEEQKNTANELMKASKFAEAAEVYSALVTELYESVLLENESIMSEEKKLCIACLNNLSMAYQKVGKDADCIEFCTKSLTLDSMNLKAYYRRALSYLALAKKEESSALANSTLSEKWDLGMRDTEAILAIESENAQAKTLKNNIRKMKLDSETSKKYNLHNRSSGDEKPKNKGVYKGFPSDPHERIPDVAPVPSVTEADIKKFVTKEKEEGNQVQLERANESLEGFREQQAEVYKKSSNYLFLDPNWVPEEDASTIESAPQLKCAYSNDTVPTVVNATTKTPKASFRDLLSKAKRKSEKSARFDKKTASKKITESAKVKGALQELQSTEDIAKKTVLSTLAVKEVIGGSRTKGSDSVKERLGKNSEMKTVKSELKSVGDSSGAWSELQGIEEVTLTKVKHLVASRNM